MDESDLVQLIDDNADLAIGSEAGTTYNDRNKAMEYFLGQAKGLLAPPGNPEHSRVVSREILEAVIWTMPDLLRVFTTGNPVKFHPMGSDDIDKAKQEGLAVNHVMLSQNNSNVVFHTWFMDALVEMDGYVKASWSEKATRRISSYDNLGQEQMTALMIDLELKYKVKVLSQWENDDSTFGVKLLLKGAKKQVEITNVRPHNLLVHKDAEVSLAECQFVQERKVLTRSDLIQEGYNRKTVNSLPKHSSDTEELNDSARVKTEHRNQPPTSKATDPIMVTETYIMADFDNDGVAELRRVVKVDDEVLENEEFDHIPYAHITPIILAHQHTGLGYYNLIKDLQEILTALNRQLVNNVFASGNAKTVVGPRVNMGDVLNRRFDQIIRTEGDPRVDYVQITTDTHLNQLIPAISFYENKKETRTGTGRTSQGLDADVLRQSTAGAFKSGLDAASALKEMIARTFASTGVKELAALVHRLMLQNGDKTALMINGKVITVNPNEWDERENLEVKVAMGENDSKSEIGRLMAIGDLQMKAQEGGAGVVMPQNAFNLAEDIVETMGFKAPGRYFTPPDQVPPKEEAPNILAEAEKIKQETKVISLQAGAAQARESEERKLAFEREKLAQDGALKVMETEVKHNVDVGEPGIGAELANNPLRR